MPAGSSTLFYYFGGFALDAAAAAVVLNNTCNTVSQSREMETLDISTENSPQVYGIQQQENTHTHTRTHMPKDSSRASFCPSCYTPGLL